MPKKAKSSRQTIKHVGRSISGIIRRKSSLPHDVLQAQNVLDLWCEYEGYRRSGKYNMVTDAKEVIKLMEIDEKTYVLLQDHYGEIKNVIIRLTAIGEKVYGD